mgnify:CR=1 FL=1
MEDRHLLFHYKRTTESVEEGIEAVPKGQVPRFKTIRCRHPSHPGKLIKRFDRSKYPDYKVPATDILAAIRRHYKEHHPKAFRQQTEKAIRTKRKHGIKKNKGR